jgi:hypothetical protein
MTITIETDGRVSFIGNLPFEMPLLDPVKTRVSRIEPESRRKWIAFRSLRTVFGDRGRAADWTRTWAGPWIVRILATGQTQTFNIRAEAIAWEIAVLNL